jgi:hypothetical protein
MTNPDIPTIDEDGNKYWFNSKSQFHREIGPAYEGIDGQKEWYINGNRHREDGPACTSSDGCMAWYINGKQVT